MSVCPIWSALIFPQWIYLNGWLTLGHRSCRLLKMTRKCHLYTRADFLRVSSRRGFCDSTRLIWKMANDQLRERPEEIHRSPSAFTHLSLMKQKFSIDQYWLVHFLVEKTSSDFAEVKYSTKGWSFTSKADGWRYSDRVASKFFSLWDTMMGRGRTASLTRFIFVVQRSFWSCRMIISLSHW